MYRMKLLIHAITLITVYLQPRYGWDYIPPKKLIRLLIHAQIPVKTPYYAIDIRNNC